MISPKGNPPRKKGEGITLLYSSCTIVTDHTGKILMGLYQARQNIRLSLETYVISDVAGFFPATLPLVESVAERKYHYVPDVSWQTLLTKSVIVRASLRYACFPINEKQKLLQFVG